MTRSWSYYFTQMWEVKTHFTLLLMYGLAMNTVCGGKVLNSALETLESGLSQTQQWMHDQYFTTIQPLM